MKLHIENLGAVKDATIDLGKKLIVFCGPNGTGKTWTAYAIGGVLTRYDRSLSLEVPDMDSLFAIGRMKMEFSPENIFEILQLDLEMASDVIDQILPVSIDDSQKLIGSFKISIPDLKTAFTEEYLSKKVETSAHVLGYDFEIKKSMGSSTLDVEYKRSGNEMFPISSTLYPLMLTNIFFAAALYPVNKVEVIPVERNSIFSFNKELSLQKNVFFERFKEWASKGELAKNISQFSNSRSTRYPKAVRDALDVADDIANISRTSSPYYDFGLEVEQLLLQGKVSVGEGGEVDFAPKRAKGKSFSFQLSSSAVKTLSSLIIYLKYQAKPNELLIIDEPELNLHPDNQILLARVFARMINKGIRLLISTHSDYIIRELNNLIMLSNKEEPRMQKVAKEFGYHKDEYILKEDVGAYLFHFKNEKAKYVTVEEIEVADNGFEVSTIEEAIKSLNAASEEIFYTLRHGYQHRDELS